MIISPMGDLSLKKTSRKSVLQWVFLGVLCLLFYLDGFLYVKFRSNVFPIVNALVLFAHLFLFKGKFRIYAISFYIPASKLMTMGNTVVGSFLTWILAAYFLTVAIQMIISKKQPNQKECFALFLYLGLVLFSLFTNIVSLRFSYLLKTLSYCLYFSIPLLFMLDGRADKETKNLALFFALGHLAANLFVFYFLYLSDNPRPFFEAFLPGDLPVYDAQGKSAFRFTGLKGDANHDSFYSLFAGVLLLLTCVKTSKKRMALHIVLALALQPFSILSGSKTYLLSLIPLSVIVFFYFLYKKKQTHWIPFVLILGSVSVLLLMANEQLSRTLTRLLNTDTRQGLVNGLTTGRLYIWYDYLSHLFDSPLKFVIGHGTSSTLSSDYHNLYLQSVWEFGLLGSALVCGYFLFFLSPRRHTMNIYTFSPILLLLFYGLSLHILYDEGLYAGVFIFFTLYGKNASGVLIEKKPLFITQSEVNAL